jgi:hypothetical protein
MINTLLYRGDNRQGPALVTPNAFGVLTTAERKTAEAVHVLIPQQHLVEAALMSRIVARVLKRKGEATADHSEVVVRPLQKVPAKIGHYADLPGEAKFQSAADFPFQNRVILIVYVARAEKVLRNFSQHCMSSTKSGADAAENIGSEARAADRISQGEGAECASDRVIGGQGVAFHADANVLAEKVLKGRATAPVLVSGQKAIVAQVTEVEFVIVGPFKGFVEVEQSARIAASVVPWKREGAPN